MANTIVDILKESAVALDKAPSDKKVALVDTVSKLVGRISGDIVQMSERNEALLGNKIPAIYAQLNAVDKRTENAANMILTCCERMMPLLKDCPEAVKKELQLYLNKIFEAGNFQDLVAQHVNEVRLIVKDIEEDATDIKAIMASDATDSVFSHQARARLREKQIRSDAHLLNGPPTDI